MGATEEELDWLANRWPYFRDTVRVTVVRHVAPVIATIGEQGSVDDATWRAFVDAVIRELDDGRARRARLYETALSFFADAAPLRRALDEAGADLLGEQGPAVRMVAVKRGLTRMRDIWIGGSEHRGKTWGRLDAISRQVERGGERILGPGGRCAPEHFEDLLRYLRVHHAADRNLPRTIESIEEYFHEFCPDCRPVAIPDGFEPATLTLETDDPIGSEEAEHALAACLGELSEEPRAFVLVHYKLTDPVEFSTAGYCQRLGLDRRRFHRVLDRALEALRACIDGKFQRSA